MWHLRCSVMSQFDTGHWFRTSGSGKATGNHFFWANLKWTKQLKDVRFSLFLKHFATSKSDIGCGNNAIVIFFFSLVLTEIGSFYYFWNKIFRNAFHGWTIIGSRNFLLGHQNISVLLFYRTWIAKFVLTLRIGNFHKCTCTTTDA